MENIEKGKPKRYNNELNTSLCVFTARGAK